MPELAESPRGWVEDRNQGLDMLRGVAALSVVLFHYTANYAYPDTPDEATRLWSAPGVDALGMGRFGVHLFFMISGFVILKSLLGSRRPADFVVSRFTRLFPTYWLCVPLTFLITRISGLQGRAVSTGDAAINLSMLQGFFSVPAVDGVYWTLMVELSFYVVMGVAWSVGLLCPRLRVPFVLLLVAVSLFVQVEHFHRVGSTYAGGLLLTRYMHLFAVGILTHEALAGRLPGRRLVLIPLPLLAALAEHVIGGPRTNVIVVAVLAAIFIVGAAGYLAPLHTRPLLVLGAISYALYLLHQNIGYAINEQLRDLGVPPRTAAAAAVLLILALAALVTYVWERPVARKLRREYRRRLAAKDTSTRAAA